MVRQSFKEVAYLEDKAAFEFFLKSRRLRLAAICVFVQGKTEKSRELDNGPTANFDTRQSGHEQDRFFVAEAYGCLT